MAKSQSPQFDITCDGSFRDGKSGPLAGVAWIIRENGKVLAEDLRRLPILPKDAKPHGSDIAELNAVWLALNSGIVPAGSNIRLRMDCQNILDWLGKGTAPKRDCALLQEAFLKARAAVGTMGSVEFIKASDRNNEWMKRANDLARTASSPVTSLK